MRVAAAILALAAFAAAAPAPAGARCAAYPADTPAPTPAVTPGYGDETPAPTPGATPTPGSYPDTPAPGHGYGSNPSPSPSPRPHPNPNPPAKITILHTNDVHAHFDEAGSGGTDCTAAQKASNKCFGGIARIKTVVDKFRSTTENVLLLDGGDQFQGTLFFNVHGSSPSTEFMNDLRYDAMSIGNHEFDNGISFFTDFVKTLNFPVLSSNIDFKTAPALPAAGIKPYTIIEKYSLGIIGYITNTTADITNYAKNVTFYDPSHPVQKYVDELRSYGIKRIICVSHNGYFEDQYLAQNTRGIDLIVGGHSHTLLLRNTSAPGVVGPYPTNITNLDGKITYVVQAYRYANYLGHLDLEWDANQNLLPPQGDAILLDQAVPQDPVYQARVLKYREAFANLTKSIVGVATGPFPNSPCYDTECAIGDLMTDCMLESRKDVGAQIAFTNAGGIRATINAGSISYADVITILPFGNTVVQFDATGAQIQQILESAAARTNTISGKAVISQPQWAGVRWTLDATKPVGQRVTATVGGKPLDLKATYKTLTNDFVAGGGDNIMPATKFSVGEVLADVFAACIKKRGTISPVLDGRMPTVPKP